MKTPGLDKVLRNHFQYCKMHEYSLMEKRYCSCGIEAARREKAVIDLALEWIEKAHEYFQNYDSISVNSKARVELDYIVEQMGIKK